MPGITEENKFTKKNKGTGLKEEVQYYCLSVWNTLPCSVSDLSFPWVASPTNYTYVWCFEMCMVGVWVRITFDRGECYCSVVRRLVLFCC